ncbi:MAG TPA: leucine-rich repeat domain-containing protein, partial [Verrucomicrobiae bacterium]
IPGSFNGYPVSAIGQQVFSGNPVLEFVTIPDTVTSIGAAAFANCSSLISAPLSYGLTNLGNEAFFQCLSLTSAAIPSGVSNIKQDTFYSCWAMTNVVISDGVTNIGEDAFNECSHFAVLTIPDSVISIGGGAFEGCPSLVTLTLTNGISDIGTNAFEHDYLSSLAIPATLTNISDGAFAFCQITNITVDTNNPVYTGVDGVLFSADQTTLILYPQLPTNHNYTIPGSVGSIGDYSFADSSVTNVLIPNSVTNIGSFAFEFCLCPKIVIPESVANIGDQAFYFCLLTTIIIPQNVTNIGDDIFGGCPLKSVYFAGALPEIDGSSVAAAGLASDLGASAAIYYLLGTTGWSPPSILWNPMIESPRRPIRPIRFHHHHHKHTYSRNRVRHQPGESHMEPPPNQYHNQRPLDLHRPFPNQHPLPFLPCYIPLI